MAMMVGAAFAPVAHAQQMVDYTVAPGPLQVALTDFSLQAGVQILFDSELTAGLSSLGLQGPRAVDGALAQLLAGTGLTWRYSSAGAIVILRDTVVLDLGPDELMIGAVRAVSTVTGAAAPYATAGATSHIAQENIQNFRGSAVSDIFRGTAGVMSGDARNGGAGMDVNVRGMQGFGRVATTIDGAENSISVYQGYQGSANRSYVDPDFIGGIDITKGSDVASRGIAGTVAMRTLRADDILAEGATVGHRLRIELGTNTASPEDGAVAGYAWPGLYSTPVAVPSAQGLDRPAALRPTQGSLSFMTAVRDGDFDLLLGYAYRRQGNYFAGENGGQGAEPVDIGRVESCNAYGYCQVWDPYIDNLGSTNYRLGEEVLNSELETHSILINGTRRFGADATLQLGYNGYFSEAGDRLASRLNGDRVQDVQSTRTTGTDVHGVTARYRWNPADNDMIDLRANFWLTRLAQRQVSRSLVPSGVIGALQQRYRIGWDVTKYGGDISNESQFRFQNGQDLTLSYGLSYISEDVDPSLYGPILNSYARLEGEREEASAYIRAAWKPLDWLTVNGGLRYTHADLHDGGDYETQTTAYFDRDPFVSGGGFSPSVGVTFDLPGVTQLYANWSSTLRYASLYESAMVSSFTLAPIGVEPERANNWEVGVIHIRDGLFTDSDSAMVKLSYFNWNVEDYIGRQYSYHLQPNGSTYQGMQILNFDSATFEGLELSARYQNGGFTADFAASYFLDMGFCLTAGVCDSATLYSDFATNHVPPEYTLDLTLSQQLMDERLTLGGRVSRVGPRAIDHGQVTAQGMSQFISLVNWEPYTLVDLFAEYRLNSDVTLSFRVENATDQYYIDPLGLITTPGPGRSFYFGLTNSFGAGSDLPALLSGHVSDRSNGRDWAGWHAGLFTGFNSTENDTSFTALDGSTNSITAHEGFVADFNGALVGGQVGYNWQFANGLILGVQGEFSRPDQRADIEILSNEGTLAGTANLAAGYHQQIDWNAALNLRAGYAFSNDFNMYGLAGVARQEETWFRDSYTADYASRYMPNGNGTTFAGLEEIDVSRNGINIGFGAEYALNDNWSIWGQFNRTFFRKTEVQFTEAREGTSLDYTMPVQVGTETVEIPAYPELCAILPDYCVPQYFENPIYEYVPVEGTYTNVNGRTGISDMTNDSFRIGFTYRF
ncbi:TonB-dependent receptor domain-containing protein [Ketogulonicigenium vulgare]|uniref:TonB-dependent receptor domain-containing protein n=1 Tax=Ketogulonicigenium vulgare TaxID=92945 RepID=UPI002359968E|nr:TonB-dependent receptor [Ketogulonicigenium vulgare]